MVRGLQLIDLGLTSIQFGSRLALDMRWIGIISHLVMSDVHLSQRCNVLKILNIKIYTQFVIDLDV